MKNLQTSFSGFLNEKYTIKDYKEFYKFANDYIDEYHTGFGNEDILKYQLEDYINSDYPYGLKNIPSKVILYRIISVKDKQYINVNNLGLHFVGDKRILFDKDFHWSIDINKKDEIYIITIETNDTNIDPFETIKSKATYPEEYEYYLKNDNNLKIINIEKINL